MTSYMVHTHVGGTHITASVRSCLNFCCVWRLFWRLQGLPWATPLKSELHWLFSCTSGKVRRIVLGGD